MLTHPATTSPIMTWLVDYGRRAGVAELVYAYGSEPYPARVGGSSPLTCTILYADVAEFGIRACLRCMSRKGWRFKSSRPHQILRG